MSFPPRPIRISLRPPCNRKEDILSAQEDYRSQFYKHYHKEAEEYDKEFMEKYEEDLNTTLIFVSLHVLGVRVLTRSQAGLFSAVTSAFIIDVQSQLRPDPNDETAALLRVLIYKIDNTTFGNDAPTLPQWTGPPHAIVQVQTILFASLAASLLAAFLAMLGKQWLNRYSLTDLRGTAIERSQNRQRKLDGIIAWYFDNAMELLPLMLQIALLLLGCALSRYLWEVDITVASVVLGITSFGIIFYSFIVAAGATSESCPYQTPASQVLRYLGPKFQRLLRLVVSIVVSTFWRSEAIKSIMREQVLDQHATALDFRCVSWMLQTSLDKAVHLSTLKHLATTTTLAGFNPTLIADCFDTFIGCIKGGTDSSEVVIVQGLEQLATVSALCFFNIISHLLAVDPTSSVLEDARQRCIKVFPAHTNFHGHYHTMNAACCLLVPRRRRPFFRWSGYKPSTHEHSMVARSLVKLALSEYQRTQQAKIPRFILHFALHSLSLHPPPPTSIIADCLSIIAIDLGCDISDPGTTASDERWAYI